MLRTAKRLFAVMSILVITAVSGYAADHLDAPGLTPPGGDTRLDINDVYAFQSPNNSNRAVLIMTLSPAAGVIGETTFHPEASYDFKIDTNGDGKEDETYKVTFSLPDTSDVQNLLLRFVPPKGQASVLARGTTGQTIAVRGGGSIRADLFDDPFFFDLDAFRGVGGRGFCDGNQTNFFSGFNTLAIVLEVPRSKFPNNIGVWARTELNGSQIDRMGRPAINTVFIPANPFEPAEPSQKNAFNSGKPKNDPRDFRGEVVDTLELFYGPGSPTAQTLAGILLPDILTVDTSSTSGFLNGRKLADDVIDTELGIVTNSAVTTDCVDNDSSFSNSFPYLQSAN